MGYEINYIYYDKLKDSFEYDRENQKNFKKVYGKATEDYPLDKLYQALMQQLARRDILIVEWEIYEFVRKKISSRITKNDLIIANRKFSMKNVILENTEESDYDVEKPPCVTDLSCEVKAPQKVMAQPVNNMPPINVASPKPVNIASPNMAKQSERVLKQVQFLPGRMTQPVGRFTVEKTYPVYRETLSANGIGMLIETVDDVGNRVKVSDEHFVTVHQNLIGDEEAKFSQNSRNFVDDSKLGWGNVIKDDLPKIR